MFFIIEKSEQTIFEFTQNSATIVSLLTIYKMETQRSVNLLDDTNNESSKFATRKYVINDQNNTEYGEGNENDTTIKFETKVIKPFLCDYSHAYILVIRDITNWLNTVILIHILQEFYSSLNEMNHLY